MPDVPAGDLEAFATRVLTRAGMAEEDAGVAAHCLVQANLRGVDTHGVMRLLQYADALANKEINPRPHVRLERAEGSHALVDADGGYGFGPTLLAAETATELARDHGLAIVGVRNSHHFGMAATYSIRIAEAGLIGLVAANTGPVMPPFGGARAAMGNNPLSVGIPRRQHPPLILDMAMSQTAFGRVRLAAVEQRAIPLGWAYDRHGQPTTDAAEALRAELLAPMGGHKGYGLSLVVDVLTAVLTGSPVGEHANAHGQPEGGIGHFVLALKPDLFISSDEFHEALEARLEEIRATPPAEGVEEVLLPGDLELRTSADRLVNGVPISDALANQLADLAERLGAGPAPW